MYNVTQLTQYIRDTLTQLSKDTGKTMDSEEAVDLLMMTMAHESHLGTYLWQTNGPAQGPFMIEPETWLDTMKYIERKEWQGGWMIPWDQGLYGHHVRPEENDSMDPMNLRDSIVIARLHYWRVEEALPDKADYRYSDYLKALSRYAKKYYNTELGSATPEKYYDDYFRYVDKRRNP